MSLKLFLFLAPVALGGWYFAGGSGGGSFSQEVDKSPQQVLAAISDLDIRQQPGSPGTDPAASGGVRQEFRTERTADGISFVVMSGNQVATRMIAHIEPLDGGRRTRVTAEVVRGDAPDDRIAPAFRSNGITLGLFSAALRDELDDLTSPPRKSREECNQLERQLLEANAPADGNPMGAIRAVQGVERELRSRGCDTSGRGRGGFEAPSNRMGNAPPHAFMGAAPQRGTSFAPGRPMVDPSPGSGR